MSNAWTAERVNQLLLLVIKRHFTGTPDYKYLAEHLGSTPDAVRVKFNTLRRDVGGNNVTIVGIPTPPSSPPKKRKAKEIKEESEENGEAEDRSVGSVKRGKHGRHEAMKAGDRIQEI